MHLQVKLFISLLITSAAPLTAVQAQVSSQSHLRNTPSEIEREDPRVNQIIERAETHFRLGELNLKDGKRQPARAEFDRAVDSVLESGMDVRSNPKLQRYYLELVERVYRMEVPQGIPARTDGAAFVEVAQTGQQTTPAPPRVDFVEQKFEPSNLDELSKLVLTKDIEIPIPKSAARPECASIKPENIELRGLQLGMTLAEVRARIPDLKVRTLPYGRFSASIPIRANKYLSRNATLKGVLVLYVSLLDSRVDYIGVVYDDSIKWDSADEFVTQVSASLSLPNDWAKHNEKYTYSPDKLRSFQCNGFSLVAGLSSFAGRRLPIIVLNDLIATRTLNRRIADAQDKKRQMQENKKKLFKP